MDQSARAQIRQIIADEDARARRAIQDRLKEIYAEFDAGELRSDETIIAALGAMEDLADGFIWDFGSKVKSISEDSEAFALIERASNAFLASLDEQVDELAVKIAKNNSEGAIQEAAYAARGRFGSAKERLRLKTTMLKVNVPLSEAPLLAPPATPKRRGGRPIAAHWDEMWAAIAVRLQTGDLQPRTQADIERAMSDWLAARNLEGGVTPVRDRARALWEKIQENRRPLVSDWEEMWATIAAQLYAGDLQPATEADVADIESAMKAWLAARNFDVDNKAIRARARSLWQKIQEAN